MRKIYVYMKKNEPFETINALILNASHNKNDCYDLYTDVDRDSLAYKQMKKDIAKEKGILIISSIKNLGSNSKEIYNELLWFKKKELEVIFADYPATHIFDNYLANNIALNVLIDVYSTSQDNKSDNTHNKGKKAKVGRRKLNFPENWSDLYDKWEASEITAKEFMELSGLKKGTFYHLVNEYRELLEMNNAVLKRG